MKPRERKPQTQTSRLVYRKNDHRDILTYNSTAHKYMYHNALVYSETDKNKLEKTDIAWIKYPKKSLINTYYVDHGVHGCMDVDRQFQYGRTFGGAGRAIAFGLECGLIVLYVQSSGSSVTMSVSDDGIVWQDIQVSNANPWQESVWHFSEDSLCWIHINDTIVQDEYWPLDHAGFVLGTITFNKNEDTGKYEVELHQYSYVDVVRTAQFVCNTKQGCIINTTYGGIRGDGDKVGAREYTFWHIDHAGIKYQKYYRMWATNTIWDNLQTVNNYNSFGFAYAKVGNRCFVIVSTQNKPDYYGSSSWFRVQVLFSADQGETWTGETLYEKYEANSYNPEMKVNIRVCDGEIFAFYAVTKYEGNKTHMLSTYTGTQWDEITLPEYIDVPVIEGGGSGVRLSPGVTTLRVAVDPLNTSNANIVLGNNLGNPRWDSNMRGMANMFCDGEFVKETDDVIRFCFGATGNGNYMVYFDNINLEVTDNVFAWQVQDHSEIADYVIEGDYCAPANVGGLVDDEMEIIGYNYYVWENGAYHKVYSTTSYTHHQLVVVSELPAEGAVNVLYKVAYYKAITDWTDNADYGG